MVVEDDARADFHLRPKWLVLLLRAAAHQYDVLVPWRTDRWARSLWDTMRTERFLTRHGIAYTSATEPFDTTTPHGRYIFHNFAMVAQFEREIMAERIRLGWNSRLRQRRWPNRLIPLGYGTLADGTLERRPEDLHLILDVWERYERCRSGPEVAFELNEAGVKPKNGAKWKADLVYKVLDNPLYVGKWPFGDGSIRFEDLRLMPDDDFDAMQRLRQRPKEGRTALSARRKDLAIRRVFGQYNEILGLVDAEEKAATVDRIEAEAPPRLDRELLQVLLKETRRPPPTPSADDTSPDVTAARRFREEAAETRRWRRVLADVLTM